MDSDTDYILLTFQLLDILPVSTIYGFYGLCLSIAIAVLYPMTLAYHVHCHKKKKPKKKKKKASKKNSKTRIRKWIEEKVNVIVLTLYGETHEKLKDFLEREKEEGIEEMKDAWKKAQLSWLAMMIRINALTLLLSTVVAFWERFLVERTVDCDDDKHCFLASNDTRFWQRPPIGGCNNITEGQAVVCFEFVYKIGDAVGLAGGILTYGIYDMKFGGMIMLFIYKQIKKCFGKTGYRIVAFVIQQLPMTIILVVSILSMCFVRYSDLAYYGAFIESFGIGSIFGLVIAIPWSVLVKDDEEDEDDSEDETDTEQSEAADEQDGKKHDVALELDLKEAEESLDNKDDERKDSIV